MNSDRSRSFEEIGIISFMILWRPFEIFSRKSVDDEYLDIKKDSSKIEFLIIPKKC